MLYVERFGKNGMECYGMHLLETRDSEYLKKRLKCVDCDLSEHAHDTNVPN